ncbi:hypothetical protein ElyMa_004997900 [Elysia marginata]|uniref:Uncharacterized protein n=1 Tax=Elysia marginata TaxID=1093978 RepID=A0AAV4J9D1_9GAST|nr:hypothetical protein ElyMa_004997900 [Elysia marginata]
MLAARLGNIQVVRVMMEAQTSGSVTIDLSATDNNGQAAIHHAMESANTDIKTSSESTSVKNSVEITRLLAACGGAEFPSVSHAGTSGDRQRPLTPTAPDESVGDFEMVDMRGSSPRRNIVAETQPKTANDLKVKPIATITSSKEVVALKEDNKELDSNSDTAKQWAESLRQEHEHAGRLTALASPAPSSRPGSRLGGGVGIPLKDKHPPPSRSALGVGGGRGMRAGSAAKLSSHHRPSSRLRASSVETEDDDEDEEISLESLSDLLGTVRQYAREIHEIYAPIQKDEEERIRKKKERLARQKLQPNRKVESIDEAVWENWKKSREQEKSALVAPLAPPPSNQHQEVRVEIHAIEEQLKQRVQGRSRPQGPAHSKSTEPSWPGGAPVAMLTVEDEQLLSSTWPRGRLRPKSRERFWSDMSARSVGDQGRGGPGGGGHSSISYPCSPSTSFAVSDRPNGRPQLSQGSQNPRLGGTSARQTGDPQANNIQHERDILNKAFQKMQKPVPILKSFNKNIESPSESNSSKANRRLKEQVITSRQSVIQVARQHQQTRQAQVQQQSQQQQQQHQLQVPSISIIGHDNSYSGNQQMKDVGGALPSATSQDIVDSTTSFQFSPPSPPVDPSPSQDCVIPSSDVIYGDVHGNKGGISRGQFKDGGAGAKSSGRGLRHRKSVDKGLGNGIVLEKY